MSYVFRGQHCPHSLWAFLPPKLNLPGSTFTDTPGLCLPGPSEFSPVSNEDDHHVLFLRGRAKSTRFLGLSREPHLLLSVSSCCFNSVNCLFDDALQACAVRVPGHRKQHDRGHLSPSLQGGCAPELVIERRQMLLQGALCWPSGAFTWKRNVPFLVNRTVSVTRTD